MQHPADFLIEHWKLVLVAILLLVYAVPQLRPVILYVLFLLAIGAAVIVPIIRSDRNWTDKKGD